MLQGEALRNLEAETLVEIVPHKDAVVASISLDEALEIYALRKVLEGSAAGEFATLATDEAIANFEQEASVFARACPGWGSSGAARSEKPGSIR